jgi:hypothetical protein
VTPHAYPAPTEILIIESDVVTVVVSLVVEFVDVVLKSIACGANAVTGVAPPKVKSPQHHGEPSVFNPQVSLLP